MSTTKAEFQALAAELIGDEFEDFAETTVLTKTTGFDYATQAATTTTQTFTTIRLEYETKQFDGQLIKIGDYMLIGERQLLATMPTPDNTTVTRAGEVCNFLRSSLDPADAAIIMHVRPQ